jgi:hypothetical protein
MASTKSSEFDRFEVARTLTPKQRWMFWEVGGTVYGYRVRNFGYADENSSHETALAALHAVDWKSKKAALAMINVTKMW